jgi:hypothetical protein
MIGLSHFRYPCNICLVKPSCKLDYCDTTRSFERTFDIIAQVITGLIVVIGTIFLWTIIYKFGGVPGCTLAGIVWAATNFLVSIFVVGDSDPHAPLGEMIITVIIGLIIAIPFAIFIAIMEKVNFINWRKFL